jgi:uncharacterized protein (TIGR04255 family)
MTKIPNKLKKDAIFQALFDIRFTSRDVTPEIITGKLASHSRWKGWSVQRLAFADIPAAVRQQDPALQFQPLIELHSAHGRLVRIGERSLSCHTLAPYPGWTVWEPELRATIDVLHSSFENLVVTRFGLRYINAVGPEHFINSVGELRLSVKIAGASPAGPLLLHYQHDRDPDHVAIVRISSREFVVNPQPPDLAAVIDVDVFTPASFSTADPEAAKAWLGRAHELAKEEFFRLIPDNIVRKLTEGKT